VPDTNLRLSVVRKLAALVSLVGIDSNAGRQLVQIISDLSKDKNWRVRHAALWLLPELELMQLPRSDFVKFFNVKALLSDNVAKMREDCVKVFHVCHEVGLFDTYGEDFIAKDVLPHFRPLISSKNYQENAVVLHAMSVLGPYCQDELVTYLLPALVDMADHKVPNLKVLAMENLSELARRIKDDYQGSAQDDVKAYLRENVLPKATICSTDEDPDVREQAVKAVDALGALLDQ